MKKTLEQISKLAIQQERDSFIPEQIDSNWIGFLPCEIGKIEQKEKELNLTLPSDYKEFLKITNGFCAATHVQCFIQPIEQIGLAVEINPDFFKFWANANEEISEQLNCAILISEKFDDQYFLLIPPTNKNADWEYWEFANWIPGEEKYTNLQEYFNTIVEILQEE